MRNRVCAGILGALLFIGSPMLSALAAPDLTSASNVAREKAEAASFAQEQKEEKTPVRGQGNRNLQESASPKTDGTAPLPQEAVPVKESVPSATKEETPPVVQAEPEPESTEKKIVINIASRSLALYQGNEKIRLYPLGLGKPYTPTPVGYYAIQSKDVNPTWVDPSDTTKVIPSGEDNPLGYRWMLLQGNYGIHGTNRPDSIGHYVSNGCIRMRESDVEALFDLVDVGTPVEITYNRIVVEKLKDNTVVYYIYPDGYERQALDVALVNKWLSGYGISSFESDENIRTKIENSDGEPTFIGKVYNGYVDGKRLSGKVVIAEGVTYLPALDVSQALSMDLQWKPEESMLVTPYGMAKGYDKKSVLYCDASDAMTLFHLEGAIEGGNSYVLRTKKAPVKAPGSSPVQPAVRGERPVPVYEQQKNAEREATKPGKETIGWEEVR